jgi:hypothetical protein
MDRLWYHWGYSNAGAFSRPEAFLAMKCLLRHSHQEEVDGYDVRIQ